MRRCRHDHGGHEAPAAAHAHADGHGASHGHGDGHGHGAPAVPTDDLRWYEWLAVGPPAALALWIGLFPATFLAPSAAAVRSAMAPGAAALAARMEAGDAVTARLPAPPPLTAHLDPIP